MRKQRLVVCHRFHRLSMLGRMLQDLVARHDAPVDFIKDQLSAKFDQCAAGCFGEWRGYAAQRG